MDFNEFLMREATDDICVDEKSLFSLRQANDRFAARLWADSKPDDVLDIVIGQLLVNGNLICLDYLPPAEFPWHKHTIDDFSALNDQLINCLDVIVKISSLEDAEILKREHSAVYDAYLKYPIQVEPLADGRYKLLRDGRHRVILAKMKNNLIPVQVMGARSLRHDF